MNKYFFVSGSGTKEEEKKTHFSLVIDELIEFKVESNSAKLFVDPLQLVEYFSRVAPRFVLQRIKQKVNAF